MDIAALREKIESLDPRVHKSLRDALRAKYGRLIGGNREEGTKKDHTFNSFDAGFAASSEEINREYQPGTIAYVKDTYPELWKWIVSAEDNLAEAWLNGDAQDFHHALDEWRNLFLRAIKFFRSMGAKNSF